MWCTRQDLKKELQRYKQQLEALEADDNYKHYEEKRTQLREYYKNKISEFQKTITKI